MAADTGGGGAEYILYIGYDARDPSRFCPGSRQALAAVDDGDLQRRVSVQSADELRRAGSLPSWLTGTPTLVSRATRQAIRGTHAVQSLRELAAAAPAEEERAEEEEGGSGEVRGLVLANEASHLSSESNFDPGQRDDSKKYDDSVKITESDLEALVERRKAAIA